MTQSGKGASTRLEFSTDLIRWNLIAGSNLESWTQTVAANEFSNSGPRYYRAVATIPPVVEPGILWSDRFEATGPLRQFGKFTVLLDDPTNVYFQDISEYPFHYQFATEWLPPFQGLSASAFDAMVLQPGSGQKAIVGAVFSAPEFLPSSPFLGAYAVQFLGGEGYPVETIRYLFTLVSDHVTLQEGNDTPLVYLPTERQFASVVKVREELASAGIEVIDPTVRSNSVTYVPGWATGRLKYVTATEIPEAFRTGTLTSDDILITDKLPAELPLVRGIVTLAPATPNSHVLILAKANDVPAGYMQPGSGLESTLALNGQTVALNVSATSNIVGVYSLADAAPEVIDYLSSLKEDAAPAIMPIQTGGVPFVSPIDSVLATDLSKVGGKAANFSKLTTISPEVTPSPALALTFSLWEDFLRQSHKATDKPLGEAITERLAQFENSVEIAALADALKEIQSWIRDGQFSPEAQTAVLEALAVFGANQRIRFRSSTNVEDTEGFVGAGLYDSFSGCLADDLDGDEVGPSRCDPSKENERGVFRAIRKVFASFYNLNAYLLRRSHHIDENEVGMAILVHRSFPDEFEAANGVGIAKLEQHPFFGLIPQYSMTTQIGADSITNPEGNKQPEIVLLDQFAGLTLVQKSSELRSGQTFVLGQDYFNLAGVFKLAYQALLGENPLLKELEFEYKKLADGSLIVKQARIIPGKLSQQSYAKAAVLGGSDFVLLQDQHIHVLASHQLKMHLHAMPVTQWYEPGQELTFDTRVVRVDPEAGVITEQQQVMSLEGMKKLQLESDVVRLETEWMPPSTLEQPFLNASNLEPPPSEIGIKLTASYETPVLSGKDRWSPLVWAETTTVTAHLRPGHPDDPPSPGSRLVARSYDFPSGWSIDSEFYWFGPDSRYTELTVGYTFALDRFKHTRITGLTTEPIVLADYFSQTYQPLHHHFGDIFLFEPGLSPDLTDTQRHELEEKDIRAIFLFTDAQGPDNLGRHLRVQGMNGSWRSEITP